MMAFTFTPASKAKTRARLALIGPPGSGKTWTALLVARGIAGPTGRIALIDSEHGSASKYAGDLGEFDVLNLDVHSPSVYVEAIRAAEAAGYDVLVIDSLSHAWAGRDGALELVDKAAKRSNSGSTFNAWRDVTPQHNALVDAIVRSTCHVVVTLRTKTEYVIEQDGRGKSAPKKIGLAPIFREGAEYEMDIVAELRDDHTLVVTKSRCSALDSAVIERPGVDLGRRILAWLNDSAAQNPVSGIEGGGDAAGGTAPASPSIPSGTESPESGHVPPVPLAPVPDDDPLPPPSAEDGPPFPAPVRPAERPVAPAPAHWTPRIEECATPRELWAVTLEILRDEANGAHRFGAVQKAVAQFRASATEDEVSDALAWTKAQPATLPCRAWMIDVLTKAAAAA
jgi:DNA polymerase III delta prime subunit